MKTYKLFIALAVLFLSASCAKNIEDLSGSIYGKVTDVETGEPLQSVTITISPGGYSAVSGSTGTFEVLDLTPDQYEIQAQKSGYSTNTKRVTVTSGLTSSGDITLQSN